MQQLSQLSFSGNSAFRYFCTRADITEISNEQNSNDEAAYFVLDAVILQ